MAGRPFPTCCPPPPPRGDDEEAWRLVDQLLLHAERSATGRTCADYSAEWWRRLLSELPHAGPDVLCWLARSEWGYGDRHLTAHQLLVETYPDEMRRLLEWGLVHRESLTSLLPQWRGADRAQYMVKTLGAVGNLSTAALLRGYLPDPDLGPAVVAALRQLDAAA